MCDSQRWLSWSLVFNPELEKLQVMPMYSQVFGSLGAVAAWLRTAKAAQTSLTSPLHDVVSSGPTLPSHRRAMLGVLSETPRADELEHFPTRSCEQIGR